MSKRLDRSMRQDPDMGKPTLRINPPKLADTCQHVIQYGDLAGQTCGAPVTMGKACLWHATAYTSQRQELAWKKKAQKAKAKAAKA